MAKVMNPPGASCGGGADVNTQLNCICDTDAAGNAVAGTCEPVGWESSQGGGYGGHGYASIADPYTGGIEVDLLDLLSRIEALEA
jgi:hypothetical protein